MTQSGLINGTKCLLVKELESGEQLPIGALVSDSTSFNRALIDSTTKSTDFRELLAGDEGTKAAEHSCECFFTSDEAFNEMRDSYATGDIGKYFFVYDGEFSDIFEFIVEGFTDTSGLNEAEKATFSLKSTLEFETAIIFNLLITNDDQPIAANNDDQIAVRN